MIIYSVSASARRGWRGGGVGAVGNGVGEWDCVNQKLLQVLINRQLMSLYPNGQLQQPSETRIIKVYIGFNCHSGWLLGMASAPSLRTTLIQTSQLNLVST